jgi:hypothetical protein
VRKKKKEKTHQTKIELVFVVWRDLFFFAPFVFFFDLLFLKKRKIGLDLIKKLKEIKPLEV